MQSPETTAAELLESWINGNRKDVIASIESEPNSVTAIFSTMLQAEDPDGWLVFIRLLGN